MPGNVRSSADSRPPVLPPTSATVALACWLQSYFWGGQSGNMVVVRAWRGGVGIDVGGMGSSGSLRGSLRARQHAAPRIERQRRVQRGALRGPLTSRMAGEVAALLESMARLKVEAASGLAFSLQGRGCSAGGSRRAQPSMPLMPALRSAAAALLGPAPS